MELYLIRHGQSTNNRGNLPRNPDPPLTHLGEVQAGYAGESLKGKGITTLYCSPMLRALQTAKIIGDILSLPPHIFTGLHEWDGVWEDRGEEGIIQLPGMNRVQMRELCPNVVLPDDVTDEGWWFHEWEDGRPPQKLRYENARLFLAHLKDNHLDTDDRVLAVWHGGSGSVHISTFLNVPDGVGYEPFSQNNAGISQMTITHEHIRLRYLNRIDHLPPDVVT